MKRILIASPHGFCTGVRRAIEIASELADNGKPPFYCLNEIVHNARVVSDLAGRGFVFVHTLSEVPEGRTVLFSAHGVPPSVRAEAEQRGLTTIDATCPFVRKVHEEVIRFAARGYTILLIGHRNHEEVIGVAGEAPENVIVIESQKEAASVDVIDPGKVAVVTQTTLSQNETDIITDLLRARYPGLETPGKSDICYATMKRQEAVKRLAHAADLVIVLGSPNSSNSRRLVEVGQKAGCPSRLVSILPDIESLDLTEVTSLGLTSGASTPEDFLNEAVKMLQQVGFERIETMPEQEKNNG